MQMAPRRQSGCPACSADIVSSCCDQRLEMRTCNVGSDAAPGDDDGRLQIDRAAGAALLCAVLIDNFQACVQIGSQCFVLGVP